jgi:hypothetical protein
MPEPTRERARSPLVVTGCVRSGTTILQRVLHRHPEISLTNELQAFLGLGAPCNAGYLARVLRRGLRRRNRREAFVPEDSSGSYLGNVARAVRFASHLTVGGRRPLTTRRVEAAYRHLFGDVRVVGDKSPSYVARLDELLDHDVSCLVIYRDCRDVVTSTREAIATIWKGMPHVRYLDTTAKIAGRWVQAIETMERLRERICIVRYEELVADPVPQLAAIAQWLGVDAERLPADLLHGSSVGRHEIGLPDSELSTVLDVAGPTMERLGYLDGGR